MNGQYFNLPMGSLPTKPTIPRYRPSMPGTYGYYPRTIRAFWVDCTHLLSGLEFRPTQPYRGLERTALKIGDRCERRIPVSDVIVAPGPTKVQYLRLSGRHAIQQVPCGQP